MAKKKEELICGEVQIKGGEFEWVCTKPPHGPKEIDLGHGKGLTEVGNHAFQPFRKVA